MPALDPLSIWNLALAEVRGAQVASLTEKSVEADACRQQYPHALGVMLEGPHDYGFAKTRGALAPLGVNDRPGEWGYAYAIPSDMASPIGLLPAGVFPTPGYYYSGPFWNAAWDYVIDDGILYTNVSGASLEYVRNDLTGRSISQMVIDALAKDLASRIAVPVKDDRDLKRELMAEAEVAWQRAIADDRNRQPEWSEYMPESLAARHNGAF